MNRLKHSMAFLWKSMAPEKLWLSIGILLTILLSGLVWVGPRCIGWIVDHAIIPQDRHQLLLGVLVLLGIEITRLLTVFVTQVAYSILGQNVIERIRGNMIQHMLKLPISYFDKVSSGRMMTRVVNDVNSLSDFFQSGFVSVLGNAANVVAIFVGLFSLNLRLGAFLLAAFIPIVIMCVIFSKRLKISYERTRNQLSLLNAMLVDFLFGMKTIRSLSLGHAKHQELDRQIDVYAHAQMNTVKNFALFHPVLSLGIGILLIFHLIFGLPLVENQTLQVGQWIAGLSYVLLLQQPLVEISDRWNFFLMGLTGVERILEVVDVKIEEKGKGIPGHFEKIEFESVSFAYSGNSPEERPAHALKEVSTTLRQGEWVGVYGESGSGKSTFLQMIFGFYQPSHGTIRWNGNAYSELNTSLITQKFGVVEQFPFLFSGTIYENLSLYASKHVDIEGLRKEFIGFPLIQSVLQNPEMEIHERGSNLSMGQKQMIAFIRAYLARPEIWILDEATAFFDHEAEQEVMRVLTELAQKHPISVLQVAHRPEALLRMKRWIRVDSGRLEELTTLDLPKSTSNLSVREEAAKNPGPQDL